MRMISGYICCGVMIMNWMCKMNVKLRFHKYGVYVIISRLGAILLDEKIILVC